MGLIARVTSNTPRAISILASTCYMSAITYCMSE